MRFLSCFTCHPVLVSLLLSCFFVVVIATRRRWRADYPKTLLSSPAAQVQFGCLDKGDESSHRGRQRERDLRAAQGVLHEGFMLYAEVLIEFVLHKWWPGPPAHTETVQQNGSGHDRERAREEPFA